MLWDWGGPPRNSDLAELALNPLVSPQLDRPIPPRTLGNHWENGCLICVNLVSICVCLCAVFFFRFQERKKKIVLKIFAALRAAFFQLNTINNRISLYNLLPQAKKIRNYTCSHEFPSIFDQISMDFSEISSNFFGDADFFCVPISDNAKKWNNFALIAKKNTDLHKIKELLEAGVWSNLTFCRFLL